MGATLTYAIRKEIYNTAESHSHIFNPAYIRSLLFFCCLLFGPIILPIVVYRVVKAKITIWLLERAIKKLMQKIIGIEEFKEAMKQVKEDLKNKERCNHTN